MKNVLLLTITTFALATFAGENFATAAESHHDSSFTERLIEKSRVRDRISATYSWKVGDWSACSAHKCGTQGKQKRKVQCVKNGSSVVSDNKCTKPKPATSQPCSAPPCAPPSTTTTTSTTSTTKPTQTTLAPTTTVKPTTTTVKPTTTTTTLPPTTTTVPTTPTTVPTPTTLPSNGSTMFPADSIWYKDVSNAALHPDSASIISWLTANGGWGTGLMKIDLGLNLLTATSTTPMANLVESQDYYSPDCSDGLKTFPIPMGGAVENNSGYQCADDSDCHLLVLDKAHNKLYESYQSNLSGNNLTSTCAIVWDLTRTYGASGRGEQCTSTDAAGFPISALLVTADEVASGSVNHALRFILPNKEMQKGVYVHPATHAGGPSGPSTAVPYGAHFRLKASVDISKLKPAAQIIAKAMKKYGMFLADGGNIALTFANDKFSTAKWSQLGLGTQDLTSLKTSDFEMVQEYDGMRINYNGNCVRNP